MGESGHILRNQTNWHELFFYRKAVVLHRMTCVFCRRFLPRTGDRTVDQMVQAARSGKQNIVEGFADGVGSVELELKLLNVARASIQELQEDYIDFLRIRGLPLWGPGHPRYAGLRAFCRTRNDPPDYEPFFETWSAGEMANCAHCLCRMVDRMMMTHLARAADDFAENGGLRERLLSARLSRRRTQKEEIAALRKENAALKAELAELKRRLAASRG